MIEDRLLTDLRSIRQTLAVMGRSRMPNHSLAAHRTLIQLERILTRPMRLAVMGEQNSGKSLLINYLLKHQVLPSGGFAGETTELLIRHSEEPSVHAIAADGTRNRLTSKAFGRLVKPEMRAAPSTTSVIYDAHNPRKSSAQEASSPASLILAARSESQARQSRLIEIGLPLGVLRQIEFVEVRACPEGPRESPSRRVFAQVDMTIWCTLATQAWKETEIVAWRRVPPGQRRTALMMATYKDAIRKGRDEEKVMARLQNAGAHLFDGVVLVSARDAIQSLLASDPEESARLHEDSNIAIVETAITSLMQRWQARRFEKAARLLSALGARFAAADIPQARAAGRNIGAALERLAAEFVHAPPSITLSDQAA
ncbi:MAG: hypothetical protein HC850_07470 [Rhodomicrobium sp.]|nr:hypothetical protein [Rhodomicrobium sp.]